MHMWRLRRAIPRWGAAFCLLFVKLRLFLILTQALLKATCVHQILAQTGPPPLPDDRLPRKSGLGDVGKRARPWSWAGP